MLAKVTPYCAPLAVSVSPASCRVPGTTTPVREVVQPGTVPTGRVGPGHWNEPVYFSSGFTVRMSFATVGKSRAAGQMASIDSEVCSLHRTLELVGLPVHGSA